jgi:hypothetical protein
MKFSYLFKSNQRRRKRQPLTSSVRVLTQSGDLRALGINFSDVGMCLFSVSNMPIGSEVKVEFVRPQNQTPVQASGTVRHRALYLYGIEFNPRLDPNPS